MAKYRIIQADNTFTVQTYTIGGVQWDSYHHWKNLFNTSELTTAQDFLDKLKKGEECKSPKIVYETEF